MQKVMTAGKYAEYSGYSYRDILTWCHAGIIPHMQRGRRIKINVIDADKAIHDYSCKQREEPVQKKQSQAAQIVDRNFDFLEALKNA